MRSNYTLEQTTDGFTLWKKVGKKRIWILDASTFMSEKTIAIADGFKEIKGDFGTNKKFKFKPKENSNG